jgi:uncharacterized protein (DUF2141 family)
MRVRRDAGPWACGDREWDVTHIWQPPERRRVGILLLAATALMGAAPALAQEVRVEVSGLRNASGTVYVAICTEPEFLQPTCAFFGQAPASTGPVVVTVEGVPPGTYAVQAVHDENGNGTLDRPGFLPEEGMGFSRDARMRMGPPRFSDAAFELTEAGAVVPLTMRYFQ